MDAEASSPPEAKLSPRTIAVVFAGLVVALTAWYFLALRQDYVILYSGLRPAQAAAVVAALEAEGVSYQLQAGGADILTPARRTDALRLRLSSSAGPAVGLDGFEIFNESDMGLTDFAQKIRYQRAIQGELARTIMMMQGVAEARVHISMPERTLFRSERRSAEAAVTLVMQPGEHPTAERVEGVQRLVAAAVPDLAASDVVVLNARGELISARIALNLFASTANQPSRISPDFVSEVVRLAIPNRRFNVQLEELPDDLAGAAAAEGAATDRRLITVGTESSLTSEERTRVRSAFVSAGLIDDSSRQLLAFRVEPVAPDPRLPAVSVTPPGVQFDAPQEHNRGALPPWPLTAIFVIAAAAICAAAALIWRRANHPQLSFEEHRELAERLAGRLESAGIADGR